MERGEGSNQLPDLNESDVLDVMPLRFIPPISLNGEAHPGFFLNTTNDQDDDLIIISPPPGMVTPLTSFTTTSNNVSSAAAAAAGGDAGPSNRPMKRGPGRPKGSQTSKKKSKKTDRLVRSIPDFKGDISQEDQQTGNAELVSSVMMRFDAVRRRLCQIEAGKGDITVALATFKHLGLHTNAKKRVGSVPGIDVGDIFFCWGEMGLVGLHVATIGIEFIGVPESGDDKPLAISVVSSGKNVDGSEDPDSLIYTGYGGTDKFRDHVPADQKLDRMNLALESALRRKSVVRVIRCQDDKKKRNGRVYIYDGVYTVIRIWEEKGPTGFKVYKFKMVRVPHQKPAYEVWKSIEKWKSLSITRPGVIIEDLSSGAENLKVCVVNEVDDDDEGPTTFTYITTLTHSIMNVLSKLSRCTCQRKTCVQGDGNCLCFERNAGELPYVERVLVTRRPMVYECGGTCCCSAECKNKVIQTGIKFSFEVFKTVECGWGLRSWDPIRAGRFICEYAGEAIEEEEEEEDDDDDYIFDTSRVYNSFQWNYEPELVGEKASDDDDSDEFLYAKPLVISAKKSGNVARFMNHSCAPNVMWQPVSREKDGELYVHIGLFAIKHIPPLTELRFDYGTTGGEGRKMCLCGSENCRGLFG